jgi:hypothetical protein
VAAFVMPHPIRLHGVGVGDIGLPMMGARAFLRNMSPYDVHLHAGGVALYPFPTMLVLLPLLFVPIRLVAAVFCGLSSFSLAFAILRSEPAWRMLVFVSPPFLSALHSVQWSPLLTAALLLPPLLPFAIVKPQLGVVLAAAGRWTWRTVGATAIIVLISIAVFPRWPLDWIHNGQLSSFNGRVPIMVVPGFLLAASLLCWRTAGGRRMIAMSVVLQRYFYDQLPLFLQPASLKQMILLLVSSWTADILSVKLGWTEVSGEQTTAGWVAIIVGTFLPALAMTLWRTPNSSS